MAKSVESASDAVARRILGVLVLLLGLAVVYFGVWMIATLGHAPLLDTHWMHRFDAADVFKKPDIGHAIAVVGVILVIVSLPTMFRGRRS